MPITGQVGYGLEVTPGTAVTPTQFAPLVGDSLVQDRDRLESQGKIAGRRVLDAGLWREGNITVKGDVQHELYNRGLGKLFTGMFGTVTSTTGPNGSGKYTHTWSGPGAPKSLTVQKGVPRADGTVDPYTYPGCMVTEWEIACKAGEFATIGVTFQGTYEIGYRQAADGATTSGSPTLTSTNLAFRLDDIGKPVSGAGIPAATTIIDIPTSTTATMSANATATASGVTVTIGTALAAASYPTSQEPFTFVDGSVTIAGSPVKVRGFTLKGNNGLDVARRAVGQQYIDTPVEGDYHEYTGSMEFEYTSSAQYDRFRSGSTFAGVFTLALPTLIGGDSVTLTTNMRYDGETPKATGSGVATQNIPIKLVGTSDAAALTVVLVNADTTP